MTTNAQHVSCEGALFPEIPESADYVCDGHAEKDTPDDFAPGMPKPFAQPLYAKLVRTAQLVHNAVEQLCLLAYGTAQGRGIGQNYSAETDGYHRLVRIKAFRKANRNGKRGDKGRMGARHSASRAEQGEIKPPQPYGCDGELYKLREAAREESGNEPRVPDYLERIDIPYKT